MAFTAFPAFPRLVLAWAAAAVAPSGTDDLAWKALADRCGSQIEWLRDGAPIEDTGTAFPNRTGPREAEPDRKQLLEQAFTRAREQGRLVLWHIYRFQGGHMYRAPILDDYMDQALWSDPTLVEMVQRDFVPLRTQCPRELGQEFGLVAWDVVEPALVFLSPDRKVLHTIDRIRTFDARWFAQVFERVLAAHPEYRPAAPAGDAAARRAFTSVDAVTLEATRRSYYEALTNYLNGEEAAALAGWRALATGQPESPFAWRAAANLQPAPDKTWVGAGRHGFEWPFDLHLAADGAIPIDTRWRRTAADAEAVATAGVQWLLRMQRPDGSWNDCRYAYWDTPLITPNAWMAITALAAGALLDWRDLDPVAVDAALARAEDYMFKSGRLNLGNNEESYAQAFRVMYCQKALAQTTDEGLRAEFKQWMQQIVDRITKLQQGNGQWAHEYPNAFVSAIVLGALKRAQEEDVGVSEAMVEKGLAGLAAARYEDGSFTYGGTLGAQKGPAGAEEAKNSCGRMPLCESALLAFGRSDAKNVAKALAVYQQYYDRFEKVHKCDFHTDGELGGFFFFHDLYHATEAVRRLPAAGQKLYAKWFVDRITSLPEIDGSFLDDHEIGKSCSTAFALLALRNAIDAGE